MKKTFSLIMLAMLMAAGAWAQERSPRPRRAEAINPQRNTLAHSAQT